MSNFEVKSKSRVNWAHKFFFCMMIHQSAINCKIELIENFPCDNNDELQKRKNEIYDKLKNKYV